MDSLSLKTGLLCEGVEGRDLIGAKKGGAGPAGTCVEVEGMLINIPAHKTGLERSRFKLLDQDKLEIKFGDELFSIKKIPRPKYYDKTITSGIEMKKIALLHGKDCLATTLYQKCVMMDQGRGCGFCAIDASLKAGTTIKKKTPEQLVEVTSEAIKDGVTHITLTTGTPNLREHGVGMIIETVQHMKTHFDLPIHVQLTPPGRGQLEHLFKSGVDTIGIHMETFDNEVFKKVCPGKSGFDYMDSLSYSAQLFGENQVSSFILGGLGEDPGLMKNGFEELASKGVIPFLIPFRPLPDSLLKDNPTPVPGYMRKLYLDLSDALDCYGVDITKNLAGCVRCGACSAIDVAVEKGG
jgi:radical SAM protein (TIGR04043 family)